MSASKNLPGWRFSSRVLLPIVLVGAAAILLIVGILILTTRESDHLALDRQTRLVSHVLSEQFAKFAHDQESVTLWDDAIRRTTVDFDPEWIDLNLGVWLYDYFGHDRVYVLNAEDKPVYAMIDGATADPSSYTSARTGA